MRPPVPSEPSRSMPVPLHTPARPTVRARRGLLPLLLLAIAGCSRGPSTFVELKPPSAPGPESGAPSIEIDPTNGDPMLTWMAGGPDGWRIWFSRSKDRGVTWSAPALVSPAEEPLQLDL